LSAVFTSIPPEETISSPPEFIVVADASPPAKTSAVSPLLSVRPLLVTPALTI
jgi:hypothetical protein